MKSAVICWLCAMIWSAVASDAVAEYSSLYVFGDSLSDSGNNAVVVAPNVTSVPIPGNAFIPTYPYASGRYTNGEVWAQTLAFLLGLNAGPSLLGGTDFAFGGAQTGPVGPISLSGGTVPPSLETQVALFLAQHGDTAPSTALYIVAGGGEDVLHALTTIEGCGDHLGCINGVIRSTAASFAEDIGTIVSALQLAGASNIVVWDVPDVGDAPVAHALGVSALATAIVSSMNLALTTAIGEDPDMKVFDAFGLLNDVIDDPSRYGLWNVTDACAQFVSCDPSQYLFWDGIHPTSAANPIISEAILSLVTEVPEPSTVVLLSIALAGLLNARSADDDRGLVGGVASVLPRQTADWRDPLRRLSRSMCRCRRGGNSPEVVGQQAASPAPCDPSLVRLGIGDAGFFLPEARPAGEILARNLR